MKNSLTPIFVSQPSLPDLEELLPYLEEIWKSKRLTNFGPFHKQFETELAKFLGVPYISIFTNGTLALLTALKALDIKGEVITTPYSFVATTHSLRWNNIKPVFIDIESDYCTMDPEKIEAAITSETTAILPVHVYGNPCKVEQIKEIAAKYGLKVIYDAAHAFGVNYKGQSICNFGDLSILSFHATKVFNTFEGGAIVCHDAQTKVRIDHLTNFGFKDETTVIATGINSKMNEIQAAIGILQLKKHKDNILQRKIISENYRKKLKQCKGISTLAQPTDTISNYAYFPIFINEKDYGISRDALYEKLKQNGIFGRRYFYPLISNFPIYNDLDSSKPENLKVATLKADSVICLPIFPLMKPESFDRIIRTIIEH
ncbi:MAG: DegT/DnrJ/EryC1/StrS family aminotransferase [Bacteroidetes bacterium]|nr:DegT/DnrJ/EryC1/StrS family aminotransferase [Bacteroidota bacterium]